MPGENKINKMVETEKKIGRTIAIENLRADLVCHVSFPLIATGGNGITTKIAVVSVKRTEVLKVK